jgi:hypothetical protein
MRNLKTRVDHCLCANQHTLSSMHPPLPLPGTAPTNRPSQLLCLSAMLLPLHRSPASPPLLRAALNELTPPAGLANLDLEPPPSPISTSRCPHAFSLLSRVRPAWVAAKDGRWSRRYSVNNIIYVIQKLEHLWCWST